MPSYRFCYLLGRANYFRETLLSCNDSRTQHKETTTASGQDSDPNLSQLRNHAYRDNPNATWFAVSNGYSHTSLRRHSRCFPHPLVPSGETRGRHRTIFEEPIGDPVNQHLQENFRNCSSSPSR